MSFDDAEKSALTTHVLEFVVPGAPVGYTVMAGKWSHRKTKYVAYKKYVQECCEANGISLPLLASKECFARIVTKSYFVNGVHPDPENVHKGVKDAMFYKAKGGDKYTGGEYSHPLYDKENPRVEVRIEYPRKP